MATAAIPKPEFASCDETSLKFNIKYTAPAGSVLVLQYKEPPVDWAAASEVTVQNGEIKVADVVDLKPGTPYFVRLAIIDQASGAKTFGPETVFDTKPIDCTPKKRSCVIC